MDLKEKIEYLMNRNEIKSIKDLSNQAEIPYTTLRSIILEGVTNIRIDTAKSLANCLNVSLDYLTGNTTLENPKEMLEEKLASIHLSEEEYDNLMCYWTSEDSVPMFETCSNPINNIDKANNMLNEIYTSYVKSNLSLLTKGSNDSQDVPEIKEKQYEIDTAFLSLLKTLDKNKILLKNLKLASYNGLNTNGLDNTDLKEIQDYIDFKRKQKRNKK